jgi:hypothetical protein
VAAQRVASRVVLSSVELVEEQVNWLSTHVTSQRRMRTKDECAEAIQLVRKQLLIIKINITAYKYSVMLNKESKAIPARGLGGPQGCEVSRLPHFIDNRPKDGGEVVSLTHRPTLWAPPPPPTNRP